MCANSQLGTVIEKRWLWLVLRDIEMLREGSVQCVRCVLCDEEVVGRSRYRVNLLSQGTIRQIRGA